MVVAQNAPDTVLLAEDEASLYARRENESGDDRRLLGTHFARHS